jgi:amino acid permease
MDYSSINAPAPAETPLHIHRFGFWTGYFFMLNCTVGAGFLSLPWAYSESGWLFCMLMQLTTAGLNLYLYSMYLEVMSCTEVVLKRREQGHQVPPVSFIGFIKLLRNHPDPLLSQSPAEPDISERRLDASKIVQVLLGKTFGYVYLAVLYIYLIGSETAYAAVFSTIFAAYIPLGFNGRCKVDPGVYNSCKPNYWVFLLIFSVVTVYLTLKGFKEQRWFQAVMSFMRFFVITLVVLTAIIAAATHSYLDDDGYNELRMPPLIDFKLLGRALPAIVFANLFIVQLPSIAVQVKDKPRLLPKIGFSVIATVCVMFLAIGLTVPVVVDKVPSLSTLAFENYSAGYAQAERPAWTYIIEYFILLFPALDVMSSFPLCSVVLADNIANVLYDSDEESVKGPAKYVIKLASSLPPLFIAFFESDLGVIIDWTGLCGFFLCIMMVFVLHIAAKGQVPQKSSYSVPSHPACSMLLALLVLPIVVGVATLNLLYPEV